MANRSMKTLVEILKSNSQSKTDKPKEWKGLEEHVQYVYQELLKKEHNNTMVARDVQEVEMVVLIKLMFTMNLR